MICLIITHLMTLPLLIPAIGHVLLFRPKVLRRYAVLIGLMILAGIFLPMAYWQALLFHPRMAPVSAAWCMDRKAGGSRCCLGGCSAAPAYRYSPEMAGRRTFIRRCQ